MTTIETNILIAICGLIVTIFGSLISLLLGIGMQSLKKMSTSIESLNKKVAVVIERSDQHTRALEKHDDRIRSLEQCS